MGADLYIYKIYKPNVELHEAAFRKAADARDALWDQFRQECGDDAVNLVQRYLQAKEFGVKQEKEPEFDAEQLAWMKKLNDAQEEVVKNHHNMYSKGYFRDSYNATSVLWAMGLSWWGDITPMLSKRGNLTRPKIKEFIALLKSHKIRVSKRWLQQQHATVDDGEQSVQSWRKYYEEKRQMLIGFLEEALKARAVVHCSL